nr:sigma-54 dependent transcriptional regulator [uncultured Desulfobulbus sp.]
MYRDKILIVDDDRLLQNSLKNILSGSYDTLIAGSGEEALRLLKKQSVDLVLLDIRLPGIDGIETLGKMRKINGDLFIIMMTAYEDIKTVVTSMKMGAHDYLVKPLDIEMLEIIIEKALGNLRLVQEVEALRSASSDAFNLADIIAESEGFRAVLDFADKAAKAYNTTVLIEGESGVGKEVVARFIHQRSSRAGKAFVGINCGAISKDLLESELFGYAKGAFTGGLAEGKKGKIEMAEGGTLLLDEIGELQTSAQVKLLRFLEEREFYPVGGTDKKRVDVRVVAATNRRLEQLVKAGDFREDLYYRLNVARVDIPPLRERKADIVPLVCFFMARLNRQFNKTFRGIAPEAQELLVRYPWKGNIRELKNMVERVILMEDGPLILPEHLAFLATSSAGATQIGQLNIQIPPQGLNLDELTKQLIVQALELSGSNRTRAAQLLGISRPTLTYRIEKHGIKVG